MSLHRPCESVPRVALVEDDDVLATVLHYNLAAAGYGVLHISNGDDAIRLIAEWTPDLVVLDWSLPNLTGIEVLRRLRCFRERHSLPVVMLTGRTDPDDRSRALSTGADTYFSKPFSLAELMGAIQQLLPRRPG